MAETNPEPERYPRLISTRSEIRLAAHDLRNLTYRLKLLRETLRNDLGPRETRDETLALVDDTAEQLQRVAERLRSIAEKEE